MDFLCDKEVIDAKISWEFVNLLDYFYRGYQRKLQDFSNSIGDKYPIEEWSLVKL